MKASVSWMYIKPYRSQLPQVKIIEGEEEIVNYITRLHAFVDAIYKKCEKINTMPLGWYVNFRYI